MKALFLCAGLSHPGGITQYNLKFIAALRALGVEVVLVERRSGGIAAKAAFAAAFFFRLLFNRPTAVICTNLNFSPLARYGKMLLGVPYAVTVYGIEVAPIRSDVHKDALRKARAIVKLFDQAERDVLRQLPETAGKFLRVPNSVDAGQFAPATRSPALLERYGLDKENKVIFTIARIAKEDGDNKGYERIIRAMPEILRKIPQARYLLAGGGNDAERMRSLVAELGLGGKVIFAGRVPDEELAAHYRLADVFAMPSKNEGFPPIVFLEALASGVPVVGGAQPDAKVPLWQEELAIVVPPDDVVAIGEAIVTVLSGKAPRHFYDRDYLRKRVLEEYGLGNHRECVRALVDALVIRN